MTISAAVTSRLKTVTAFNSNVFPDSAPESVPYPFCVYKMQSVERTYLLDGSTNGLPVASFQFMIFGTNKIAVEELSVEVGQLFSGYRGTVAGTEIASSVWNNQETNDVFIEGNDIPVYSYINSHLIQFVEE
jgi:hypothetical protein